MILKSHKLSLSNNVDMEGPLLISTRVFKDKRGFFMESWNLKEWETLLKEKDQNFSPFLQDNHSKSSIGVLRGLHYQKEPYAQGKLVRCISGSIFDVAVDLRRTSTTFGKYVGAKLTSENHQQLWIPVGFAHGFLTLSESAEVAYKTTNYWHKESEGSVLWNDPSIDIDWPINFLKGNKILVSDKDEKASLLSELTIQDLFS